MSKTFVFPGQGSQFVGMGKELADNFDVARQVFEEVNDAISFNLFKVMVEGPDTDLNMTENTQPALMAMSQAVLKVIEKESGKSIKDMAKFVAGHSLGEYSALCAAGVFSISDTAKLLKIRGQAMQKAVPFGVGSMAAVIGVNFEQAMELAKEAEKQTGKICVAANDNADGQIVLSGHMEAIDKVVEIASEYGAKRCLKLPVSAPFHSPLMAPAAEVMKEALDAVVINKPSVPLIANVLAEATSDENVIKEKLVEQICGSVRWRESVMYMKAQGIETLVEVGAGKVLSGLTRRIEKSLTSVSVGSPADIEEFIKTI